VIESLTGQVAGVHRALGLAVGYYAWKGRPGAQTLRHIWLADEIADVYKRVGRHPRLAAGSAEL